MSWPYWSDYRFVRNKARPIPEFIGKYYESIFDYEKGVYDNTTPRLYEILEAYYIGEPNSIYDGIALFLAGVSLPVIYGCSEQHIKDGGKRGMKKNKSFIECFSNFLAAPEGLTEEDLIAELKEQGVNIDRLRMRVLEIIEKYPRREDESPRGSP